MEKQPSKMTTLKFFGVTLFSLWTAAAFVVESWMSGFIGLSLFLLAMAAEADIVAKR